VAAEPILISGDLTLATSNPAFSQDLFPGYEQVYGAPRSTTMTVQGAIVKTFVLLAILLATAAWSWNAVAGHTASLGLVAAGGIGGFVLAMITVFKPTLAPWTAPLYAAAEGVFLGAISQFVETQYGAKYGVQGIVVQALGLTSGVLMSMLFCYLSRLIRVTEKLKLGIVMATGALCLFYFVSILLSFFGVQVPLLFSNSIYGVGFSLFVVGLAAFNLLLDFDFIETAAHSEAPKYMEWYGAFGLMVTLIWLYMEILRLLMKLSSQRD
jgi:uncharacterized YccA/Bax inhibitor family protein